MAGVEFDFEEIEAKLDLVVPDIYRMFIDAVVARGYDLHQYRIYHDTQTLLKGNRHMRRQLGEEEPRWRREYLDFGVGDGCGNYYFLLAADEDVDAVRLWAHDPPGIEQVGSATEFFKALLSALENEFKGPTQFEFDGSRSWD